MRVLPCGGEPSFSYVNLTALDVRKSAHLDAADTLYGTSFTDAPISLSKGCTA